MRFRAFFELGKQMKKRIHMKQLAYGEGKKMHKEYLLSCFDMTKMEDENEFFESFDEMELFIEQNKENIIIDGTYHLEELNL